MESTKKKILFIGSKRLGYRIIRELARLNPGYFTDIITIDDINDQRSYFEKILQFSERSNISVHIPKDKTHSENIIRQISPDICIVACWYWIFSDKLINNISAPFLGFHFSLLPDYKGSAPLVWAIINDEKISGVTLFSISSGIDSGDIWAQEKIKIRNNDDIDSLSRKAETRSVYILKKYLDLILTGRIKPSRQKPGNTAIYPIRTPEDGMIKNILSSRELYNFIRAQTYPYPGAFIYYRNKKLIIWKADISRSKTSLEPGILFTTKMGNPAITCNDSRYLILREISYGGKRGVPGKILRANKNNPTTVLFEKPDAF